MNPTNKLRFVERRYPDGAIRVLQQWWEDNRHDIHWVDGAPGEWRDVPLEVET